MNQVGYESFNVKKLPPAWPKGLLTFVLIICFLTIGVAIGLNYFNNLQNKKLQNLTAQFESLRADFPVAQEKEIATFEKKLTNLRALLNNHVYFSNVLNILEKLTHPQVYYTDLSYTTEKNTITLSGVAKTQQILSEAVNGFINDPQEIQMVVLKNVKANTNGTVNFNLDIILNEKVLKYQPAL